MELEITKIKKINLVFEQIENLYAEIFKIESLALFASNNDFKAKFNLTLSDDASKFEPDKKLDHFTDMRMEYHRVVNGDRTYFPPAGLFQVNAKAEPRKDDKNTLSDQLSETATMQILGIILCEKKKNLKLLIDELQKMGFSLKETKS